MWEGVYRLPITTPSEQKATTGLTDFPVIFIIPAPYLQPIQTLAIYLSNFITLLYHFITFKYKENRKAEDDGYSQRLPEGRTS